MRIHTILLATAVALTGCAGNAPTAATTDNAGTDTPELARAAARQRPVSGSCTLTFTPPPFPIPPTFEQTDRGTCQFSHLGKTEFVGMQVINLAAGTQTGTRTLTAANGDILRTTHVGTSSPAGPGRIGFVATLTVVGGTGRFANATGQMQAIGTADLAARTTVVGFDGWIAYDASDRRGM